MIWLLDLDGPILDVSAKYAAVYERFLGERGAPRLPREAYWRLKRAGLPARAVLEASGADRMVDPDALTSYTREVIETEPFLALDRPFPDVAPTLAHLLSRGDRLVLVTLRRSAPGVELQLSAHGLAALFHDVLVVGKGSGSAEDKRDAVLERGIAVGQEDTFVGDTELDVRAARLLGVRAIAVTSGLRDAETLELARPDAVCDGLSAAVDWVEGRRRTT